MHAYIYLYILCVLVCVCLCVNVWITYHLFTQIKWHHTATHYSTPQHTTIHCNTLHHTSTTHAVQRYVPQSVAVCCSMLQHTATPCIQLQHTTTDSNPRQQHTYPPSGTHSISNEPIKKGATSSLSWRHLKSDISTATSMSHHDVRHTLAVVLYCMRECACVKE